jgi:hypothetical protein
VELVFGIAVVVSVFVFGGVGLAVGATAEGPDPGPPSRSPLNLRATRCALLLVAAFMAVLGAEAALVAGWQQDPSTGRAEALVFLVEGVVDLALALIVLMPAWTLRRVWVLRLLAACWIVVGPVALVLTFGSGPLATFYLGLGPDLWAAFSVVAGAMLVWLSSLGGGTVVEPAAEPLPTAEPTLRTPPSRLPPTHWRGIVSGVALASLVAISTWPLAQFVAVSALGGCTPQWLLPGNPNFCVSGRLDGGSLKVSGQTTLPDGTLVEVTVSNDEAEPSAAPEQLRVPVSGGAFSATFDVARRHVASVIVTAALHMTGQPAAVAQSYGADGHELTGPTATADGSNGGRSLQAVLHFDLG